MGGGSSTTRYKGWDSNRQRPYKCLSERRIPKAWKNAKEAFDSVQTQAVTTSLQEQGIDMYIKLLKDIYTNSSMTVYLKQQDKHPESSTTGNSWFRESRTKPHSDITPSDITPSDKTPLSITHFGHNPTLKITFNKCFLLDLWCC